MDSDKLAQVAQRLHAAHSVVILTGAGVSKESGIPTYRDAQDGEWSKIDSRQVATVEGYRANPQLAWRWSESRRDAMQKARPNAGHFAIAELENLLPNVTILTQNIDGLHQASGSKNVIELHGSIHRHKCFENCQGNPTPIHLADLPTNENQEPPVCPHCGAWVRPDVVWFNEILPDEPFVRARSLVDTCDVLMSVGTSGVVMPAASFPYRAKRWNDAYVIDVNPAVEEITLYADLHIAAPSGEALPEIVRALQSA